VNLIIQTFQALPPGFQRVEVVERKGIGHPDTICDGVAEHICVRLCRYCMDQFGLILHHNVDKILLCGGASRVSFGGGEVLQPIEMYIGGRATHEFQGKQIPVDEIAVSACREWFQTHLPVLDLDRALKIMPRIRAGSSDLVQLFGRSKVAASNDTACGVGFAPLTDLEKTVLGVERSLNSAEIKQDHPAIGADIKVMGIRQDDRIELTISCAFVSAFVRNLADYIREKDVTRLLAIAAARRETLMPVEATVNAADDLDNGSVFLTVTGTSAEAGDDGEVGRGNRVSGLITPYRLMTLEAAAGKNPVSHVGKLYNLMAGRLAGTIASDLEGVVGAECVLASQIGRPVTDPHVVDIRLTCARKTQPEACRHQITAIVESEFSRIDELRENLFDGRVPLY
jgi:S-adenosylmethionine synthetase